MILLLLVLLAVTYSGATATMKHDLSLPIPDVQIGSFPTNRGNEISTPESEYVSAQVAAERKEIITLQPRLKTDDSQDWQKLFGNFFSLYWTDFKDKLKDVETEGKENPNLKNNSNYETKQTSGLFPGQQLLNRLNASILGQNNANNSFVNGQAFSVSIDEQENLSNKMNNTDVGEVLNREPSNTDNPTHFMEETNNIPNESYENGGTFSLTINIKESLADINKTYKDRQNLNREPNETASNRPTDVFRTEDKKNILNNYDSKETFSVPIEPEKTLLTEEKKNIDNRHDRDDNDMLPKEDDSLGQTDYEQEFGLINETSYRNYFLIHENIIDNSAGEDGERENENISIEPLDLDDNDDEDLATNGFGIDGDNIDNQENESMELKRTKRSTWGSYSRRYCASDLDCYTTECCMADPLGPQSLAFICWRRAKNGYCARPMACRYNNDCRSYERCIITRILFHHRYWAIRIGNCVSAYYFQYRQ